MNKLTTLVVGGLIASLIVATGGWLLVSFVKSTKPRAAPSHAAVLIDPSDSRLVNCPAVTAASRKFMTSPGIEKGSKLSLFTTGDFDTAEEPVLRATFDVPFTRRVQEGKKKVEAQIQETLGQIKKECDQIRQTKRSPILLGIQRAVEHLRNLGCDGQNECSLSVQTDLQELSEQSVKIALADKSKQKVPHVKRIIDNTGITVSFCGAAEVTGKSNKPHNLQIVKLTEDVWRGLFTSTDKVVFNSHCERESE